MFAHLYLHMPFVDPMLSGSGLEFVTWGREESHLSRLDIEGGGLGYSMAFFIGFWWDFIGCSQDFHGVSWDLNFVNFVCVVYKYQTIYQTCRDLILQMMIVSWLWIWDIELITADHEYQWVESGTELLHPFYVQKSVIAKMAAFNQEQRWNIFLNQ